MKGYVRKRGDSYRIVVSLGWDPKTLRYKQHTETTTGSKPQAEARLHQILRQLDMDVFIPPAKLTLGEFLDEWYKQYVVPTCKPRTADSYLSIINQHLKPALGQLPLGKIKPVHILRYQSDKLAGDPGKCIPPLSSTSVRHHHMALHGALRSAVDWEYLSQNPCDAVKAPRQRKAQLQTWNKHEMSSFLEAARESFFYNLFYTELYTGLRLGEITAPRWRDLDLKRGTLEVSRSLYQRHGHLEFGSLKNASSYRSIQLTGQNLAILQEQRKQQEFYHLMLEIPFTQDDLIFSHPDGSPLLPSSVSRAWQDIARKAGIKIIRFHDARHTHASMLMAAGWNPKLVQERLGHSSINTTMDIYSHTTPDMYREAMKRFDEFMG